MRITAANGPLTDVYPVIPWYITAQWSTGAQGTFPPMVNWRKLLDRVCKQPWMLNATISLVNLVQLIAVNDRSHLYYFWNIFISKFYRIESCQNTIVRFICLIFPVLCFSVLLSGLIMLCIVPALVYFFNSTVYYRKHILSLLNKNIVTYILHLYF